MPLLRHDSRSGHVWGAASEPAADACQTDRLTFASFDDLVAELTRQLGSLVEQRAIVAVQDHGGQAADEAGP